MKAVTVKVIKDELVNRSHKDLMEMVLRLSKFKKENKELLTYLLFESASEAQYINTVKAAMDADFAGMNTYSYFYMKKTIRKILRNVKKYIRYSLKKQTEVELLMYYCMKLNEVSPNIHRNRMLHNLYERQIKMIEKAIAYLHEDLQYDYGVELEELRR